MREFTAKNAKQLNLCLRLLYAEHVSFSVRVQESTKKKIEYMVGVDVSEQRMNELEEKYRILIS